MLPIHWQHQSDGEAIKPFENTKEYLYKNAVTISS